MSLPIESLLPAILDSLARTPRLVLQAAPGAGKTTRVPPALLEAEWLAGRRILLLEPRRVAARAVAAFMARQRGEQPGGSVGYRVRLDSRVGPDTRIEVVTEGVLTRLLQDDPELTGYGAVLFDEFHERSLQADLGLALCREVQQALRPDLRLVVMSATLDGLPVAGLLGDAPVLESRGRSYPVEVEYRPPRRGVRLESHVAAEVRRALAGESGSLLVFLPGIGEIRRTAALLEKDLPDDVRLVPFYGDLSAAEQDRAIAPSPAGERKLVLATALAESSLTIEGIRVVVDAGLARRPAFDPGSGMSRLVTGRVSRAVAEQRRGRAGRLEPGRCIRLWSESEKLPAQPVPEILQADLLPLVLELAQWGATDPAALAWLDPPPAAAWAQAVDLLRELEAIDAGGRITPQGRAMQALPVHPRLAHMLLRARDEGGGRVRLACELAALLEMRDPLARTAAGADLEDRLRHLHGRNPREWRETAARLRRMLGDRTERGAGDAVDSDAAAAGRLLAQAFPDRVAQARGGRGRFRLANGRGAWLPEDDPLAGEPWLAVAALDGERREARIRLAARLRADDLRALFAARIRVTEEVGLEGDAVAARRVERLGALELHSERVPPENPLAVQECLLDAVRAAGLETLNWTPAARQWQARVRLLREHRGEAWPDVSDTALLTSLQAWLGPFLVGLTRLSAVQSLDLLAPLQSLLDYNRQQELEQLAPVHWPVPSGSRIRLDYTQNPPVLAARLQELFGLDETPRIVGGRVPLVVHLLSPAGRPVQVTRDLAGFWRTTYEEVRRELKGRYPKHYWPENPHTAEATARVRPRAGKT